MILLIFLTFGTLAVVLFYSHNDFKLTSSDFKVIKFTIYQAVISALISSIMGMFLARSLMRQSFWGKSILITILGAPFILPTIVAILGIISFICSIIFAVKIFKHNKILKILDKSIS